MTSKLQKHGRPERLAPRTLLSHADGAGDEARTRDPLLGKARDIKAHSYGLPGPSLPVTRYPARRPRLPDECAAAGRFLIFLLLYALTWIGLLANVPA